MQAQAVIYKFMLSKFRQTVKAYGMLVKGDTVLCAVSGGPDSMVMLSLFSALKDEYELKLVVAHLDHNLRGQESRRDCAFVKSVAKALGLGFVNKRLAKGALEGCGQSLQEAARKKRYEFLLEAASSVGATRIATGHTLDDQAETVLLRLIRGASTAGLGGIPPVRVRFIRPLIEIERDAIEEYAGVCKVSFVTDSSNLTDKYLRNDVRRNLIPLLQADYNPNIKQTLARAARLLRQDSGFIEDAATVAFKEALLAGRVGLLAFDRRRLSAMHPAIASRIFLNAAEVLTGEPNAYSLDVAAFLALVASKRPNLTVKGAGVWVTGEYGRIVISAAKPSQTRGFSVALKTRGVTIVSEAGFRLNSRILNRPPADLDEGANVAFFDYDSLIRPVIVRPFFHGDKMRPIGMKGHKKIKDIYIDAKIPLSLRPSIPLLVSKDAIIWAAGVRRSGLYMVGKQTKRVLKVEYLKDREK